ncbi:hypothetical protein [Winogradskyella algicola]|uniref:hypothetical protein n=1 Tax=Winogradskyella algicola TaxID=2575815 RepID=UPI001109945C|nr:hypothetical protein [Winogradskyella algicola]
MVVLFLLIVCVRALVLKIKYSFPDAIQKGLKKEAGDVLKHEDDFIKHLDEVEVDAPNGKKRKLTLEEKDKLLDDLYKASEKTRNSGKITIKNDGVITVSKFNKIAQRIKKEYGVEMFLIDRNNEKFSNLFKAWQNKPLEGFWADQPLRTKNYGIDVDGPALYLFKGTSTQGIYEVTSYTVQHELYHMEMWLKVKERFPNDFIRKFHQLPDEVHEAYVLSEFVKARKYTKTWDEADILNDLDAFNLNFRFGKSKKALKDFESFDLETYLKDL